MHITVKAIEPPRKAGAIASATVEIAFDNHRLTIADWRILRNRTGELWVAPPSYAVPEGKSYHYENTVVADRALLHEVAAVVLDAYERRQAGGAA